MINRLTVQENKPQINVRNAGAVTVLQKNVVVTVYSESITMAIQFEKFDFTATQGQTVFTLTTIPVTMIALYINGVAQNEEDGDFTIVGLNVILDEGVDAGDHVFGVYQEVGA